VFHARTKHIELDFYFVREDRVASKLLDVRFISTNTRLLMPSPRKKFEDFKRNLNLCKVYIRGGQVGWGVHFIVFCIIYV
jgi:hypothetical protein